MELVCRSALALGIAALSTRPSVSLGEAPVRYHASQIPVESLFQPRAVRRPVPFGRMHGPPMRSCLIELLWGAMGSTLLGTRRRFGFTTIAATTLAESNPGVLLPLANH